jgi:hypothetical protein
MTVQLKAAPDYSCTSGGALFVTMRKTAGSQLQSLIAAVSSCLIDSSLAASVILPP